MKLLKIILSFLLGIFLFLLLKNGSSSTGFYVVLSVIIFSIGLLTLSAIVPNTWQPSFLLSSLGVIATLTVFEVYVQKIDIDNYRTNFDNRTRYEVVKELRESGIDAYPVVSSWDSITQLNLIKPIPIGGIPNVLTVWCNEPGRWLYYQSDRYGLNNQDEIWDNKVDVYLLGDSFAHGGCTARNNTTAAQMNHLGLSTVSLGMGSNGPYTELSSILELGSEKKPRYVFWLYYEDNDLFEVKHVIQVKPYKNKLKPRLEQLKSAGAIEKIDEISKLQMKLVEEEFKHLGDKNKQASKNQDINSFLTFSATINRINVSRIPDFSFDQAIYQKISELVDLGRQHIQQWDGRMIFVYLPRYKSIKEGKYHESKETVLDGLLKKDIPIVDIGDDFFSLDDPLSVFHFRSHGHYNAKGHQIIANRLTSYINQIESSQASNL